MWPSLPPPTEAESTQTRLKQAFLYQPCELHHLRTSCRPLGWSQPWNLLTEHKPQAENQSESQKRPLGSSRVCRTNMQTLAGLILTFSFRDEWLWRARKLFPAFCVQTGGEKGGSHSHIKSCNYQLQNRVPLLPGF